MKTTKKEKVFTEFYSIEMSTQSCTDEVTEEVIFVIRLPRGELSRKWVEDTGITTKHKFNLSLREIMFENNISESEVIDLLKKHK